MQLLLDLMFLYTLSYIVSYYGRKLLDISVTLANIIGIGITPDMDREQLMQLASQEPQLQESLTLFAHNLFLLIGLVKEIGPNIALPCSSTNPIAILLTLDVGVSCMSFLTFILRRPPKNEIMPNTIPATIAINILPSVIL